MNWKNLKYNRCPQCRAELTSTKPAPRTRSHVSVIVCSKDCGFSIRPQRMKELVAQQNSKRFNSFGHSAESNQELLNNL